MEVLVPPPLTQDVKSWERWLRANAAAQKAAKGKKTRAIEWVALPETQLTKRDGRWVQAECMAFSGDFSAGEGEVGVAVEAEQEATVARIQAAARQTKRGSKSKHRAARRRRNARLTRELLARGLVKGSRAWKRAWEKGGNE